MKTLVLLLLLLTASPALLQAQETPLPTREGEPLPQQDLPVPPPELIPDDILPPPAVSPAPTAPELLTIPQLDQTFEKKPLTPESENRRQHIEYRKLRNRAQNDPQVKAALARANAARTDLEKRKLLARHIELFFGKMIALSAAEMKPYLLARKQEALGALPQPRVRPESVPSPMPVAQAAAATATPVVPAVPISPPLPTLEPAASPMPSVAPAPP